MTFTVFTATFNRAHLLGRVYSSLCRQTMKDFEWLIIDDGSTDGTESHVRMWQQEQRIDIRYWHQPNLGRHRAFNRAIQIARGDLFALLDSDDAIVANALERLLAHWHSIPEPDRSGFSGVTCLCTDQTGKLVGCPFPADRLDCRHFEAATHFGARGEKWGFHRTSVIRRFPFPEIAGEKFCAEGLVWNRIGRHYLMRHVNEQLKIYFTHDGSLTSNVNAIRVHSPNYARLYYREYLDLELPLHDHVKAAVNYVRFSVHAGLTHSKTVRESGHSKLVRMVYPIGLLVAKRDKRQDRPVCAAHGDCSTA